MLTNPNILICVDCAIATVNDDYTGMDEATEARVRKGLQRIGFTTLIFDEDGEYPEHTFSTQSCDCCGSYLAGKRYEAEVVW